MNLSNLRQSRIGGAILALSLLLGIGIMSSLTAQAQYPQYPDRDGQYRRDRDRDWRRNRDRDRDWDRDRDRRDDRYGRNRGYGNYGRYGNTYRYAEDRGYQDGLNTGSSDANRGQSYDPQRSHYYRNATYGYDSSYGNKGAYKQAYRDGFLRGYEQGYRRYRGGYGRRNNGRWFPF